MHQKNTTAAACIACNTNGLSGTALAGRNFVRVPEKQGYVTGPEGEEKTFFGRPFFGQSACGKV